MKSKYKFFFTGSLIILLSLLSLSIGTVKIPYIDTFKICISKIWFLNGITDISNIKDSYFIIITDIRLPRIISAFLIGAGLAVSGSVYQGVFKNPMAEPYVLGTSAASSLGAAIGIVFFHKSYIAVTFISFICGILSLFIVYNIASLKNKTPVLNLILAGIAVGFLFSGLVWFLMILSKSNAESIIFWIMGSISAIGWEKLKFIFPSISIVCLIVWFFKRELDILTTGDENAAIVGVDIERVKKILIILTVFMTSLIVAMSGVIGFIGMIIPHISRMIIGNSHKRIIPFSAMAGALTMIAADFLSRIVMQPSEIPVGVITSLAGAPYFLWLLYKNKDRMI